MIVCAARNCFYGQVGGYTAFLMLCESAWLSFSEKIITHTYTHIHTHIHTHTNTHTHVNTHEYIKGKLLMNKRRGLWMKGTNKPKEHTETKPLRFNFHGSISQSEENKSMWTHSKVSAKCECWNVCSCFHVLFWFICSFRPEPLFFRKISRFYPCRCVIRASGNAPFYITWFRNSPWRPLVIV